MWSIKNLKGHLLQISASFTATLVFLANGMDIAWSSPAKIILLSNDSHIPATEDDMYYTEMLYYSGGFPGVVISLLLLKFFGRRTIILFCSFASCITWTLIATAGSILQITIVRLFAGVITTSAYVSVPMYISEITDPKIRGFLGSLVFIMNLSGITLMYCIGPFMSIPSSALVGIGISCTQFITFFFHPESPYYLLEKNRKDDALKSLQILNPSTKDFDEKIRDIQASLARQKAEKGKNLDMLKVASIRKALIIVVFLQSTQNFLGIAVMSMNYHTIMDNNALISNEKSAIIFGVIMIGSSILGSVFIDKIGRRVLFTTSVLFTTIIFSILAIYFFLRDVSKVDCTSFEWIPVLCVIGYAIFFKFGAGLLPIIVPAEILPISIKTLGMSIGAGCICISGLLSIHIYYFTMTSYGLYVPFALFAAWGVFSEIFFYFYVPETKGKTLEQIQMLLKGNEWKDAEISKNML